jgi:MFS family permease
MALPESSAGLLRDRNLHVVFGITLMAIMGVASVTPVFPNISAAFEISPQATGLLITVFTVPGVLLTPVLGVLADRIGRRTTLLPSLLLFGIAGTACGFARDFEVLLALRFAQGVGAAALGALNVTLIGDLYAGGRRTAAFGWNATVLSVGAALYPAVGGSLAALGWFMPFFLPALAIPVALMVLYRLRNPEPRVQRSLRSYIRQVATAVGDREVLILMTASVATFILLYGAYLTYFPFVLSRSFGASALWIGMVMSATSVATAIAASQLGRLASRFTERRLIQAGFVLYIGAMASIPHVTSVWTLAVPVLLFGVANGINIPSILTVLTGFAPAEYRGAFMAVNGTLLRLGQTLGPVVVGAAFTGLGMHAAFYVSAILAGAMFLGLVGVLRKPDVGERPA